MSFPFYFSFHFMGFSENPYLNRYSVLISIIGIIITSYFAYRTYILTKKDKEKTLAIQKLVELAESNQEIYVNTLEALKLNKKYLEIFVEPTISLMESILFSNEKKTTIRLSILENSIIFNNIYLRNEIELNLIDNQLPIRLIKNSILKIEIIFKDEIIYRKSNWKLIIIGTDLIGIKREYIFNFIGSKYDNLIEIRKLV